VKALSLLLFVLLSWSQAAAAGWLDWWLTPDQQGERLLQQQDYTAAAAKFTTPERIGAALFLAGDFQQAAAVLGRSASPEAAYNRGNALVMLGKYAEAIDSYELALNKRPDWVEAEENLGIARIRLQALAPPEDDYGGTGGMLEADEIVFDDTDRVNKSSGEQVTDESLGGLSEEALRAQWLRRVETSPADFLAAKFAYQLAAQNRKVENDGND